MVVQHNISAMNANRLFGINNSGLSKSLEKISSEPSQKTVIFLPNDAEKVLKKLV